MAGKQTLNSLQEEEGPNKKQRITEKNRIRVQPETKIENCSPSALLQIDLVAEILSRLPAKSVAKFRCVCKRRLYLTRDSHFVNLQHERSSSHILFNECVRYGKIKLYDFNNPRNGVLRELISGKQQGDVAIYWESLISPKKLSEVNRSL